MEEEEEGEPGEKGDENQGEEQYRNLFNCVFFPQKKFFSPFLFTFLLLHAFLRARLAAAGHRTTGRLEKFAHEGSILKKKVVFFSKVTPV